MVFFLVSFVWCNFNCSALLLNYIVTLVRLSLVTIEGYLLACMAAASQLVVIQCEAEAGEFQQPTGGHEISRNGK